MQILRWEPELGETITADLALTGTIGGAALVGAE